ncbi:MAG: helix-turn-helix transcriptional regulator [Burkholderiaceae bacterium]
MNKQFRGQLIDINSVKRITGFRSTQTIYNKMNDEGFPRPVAVGVRTKRWIQEEVFEWVEARIEASRKSVA